MRHGKNYLSGQVIWNISYCQRLSTSNDGSFKDIKFTQLSCSFQTCITGSFNSLTSNIIQIGKGKLIQTSRFMINDKFLYLIPKTLKIYTEQEQTGRKKTLEQKNKKPSKKTGLGLEEHQTELSVIEELQSLR